MLTHPQWILWQSHESNFHGNTYSWYQSVSLKITLLKLLPHQPVVIKTHWGLVTPFGDRSGSALAQVVACCLTAPSHYLNQCWFIISKVLWHSSEFPKVSLKITFLKLNWNLPGANELMTWSPVSEPCRHSEASSHELPILTVSRQHDNQPSSQQTQFSERQAITRVNYPSFL